MRQKREPGKSTARVGKESRAPKRAGREAVTGRSKTSSKKAHSRRKLRDPKSSTTLRVVTAKDSLGIPKPSIPSMKSASGAKNTWPRHGQTQILAFARDPSCLYASWEVTPERVGVAQEQLKKDIYPVLLVFHMDAGGHLELIREVPVEPGQRNHYVEMTGPGGHYVLEIGHKTQEGGYLSHARSRPVHLPSLLESLTAPATPNFGPPSDVLVEYFARLEAGLPVWGGTSSVAVAERKKKKARSYHASNF